MIFMTVFPVADGAMLRVIVGEVVHYVYLDDAEAEHLADHLLKSVRQPHAQSLGELIETLGVPTSLH